MAEAKRDQNQIVTLMGVTDDGNLTPVNLVVDPTTGRLKVSAVISSGGGVTSLNALTAGTQLFAKVNDTNVTMTIGSLVDTHTFTLGWTGTLAVARGGTGGGDAATARTNLGLGNIDNTSDANKPVSSAQQTALNLKANLASPTFTGTVTVPTPSNDTDASTKAYVDATAQGLSVKQSCRLATAVALPTLIYANGSSGVGATLTGVSTGVLAIDGVNVVLNDRILVKDQASTLQNGIYKCTTAGAIGVLFILTRATDSDTLSDLIGGFTFIEEGTTNTDAGFVNTNTTASLTAIGTDAVTYTQFSGAGQITAGAALTKTGNTLDVAVDGVGIEVNADALRLKDAGVTLAKMANLAQNTIIGRVTASTGVPEALTAANVRTIINVADGSTANAKATKAEAAAGTDDAKFLTALAAAGLFSISEGTVLNGKISVTVATNDLTLALKGKDGNDPSASNPVYAMIGGNLRTITAALSVTALDATNWCNSGSAELATKEVDYFAYLGYNATDGVVIGFSRIPSATCYGDFSATSTNEKFCKISTISNAASTDYYNVIGRFTATLSATAAFVWTVPAFTTINLIQKPIYETRWLSWVPVYTSGSGTYTSVTPTLGYKISMDRMYLYNSTNIVNKGTAAGNLLFTVPFNFSTISQTLAGSEVLTNGYACGIFVNSGTPQKVGIVKYDQTTVWNTGQSPTVSGVVQI